MSDDPVADRMALAADDRAPSAPDDPVASRMYAASVHGSSVETHGKSSAAREWLMAPVGAAEEFGKLATGAVASIPAGLAYGGAAIGKAFGADVNPADVQRRTQDYFTYHPQSDSAKAAEADLATTYGPVGRAASGVADRAATAVGRFSPTAETFLREAPSAAQAAAGVLPLVKAGSSLVGASARPILARGGSRSLGSSSPEPSGSPGTSPEQPALSASGAPRGAMYDPSAAETSSGTGAGQAPLTASGAPRGAIYEPTDVQKPFMDERKAAPTPEAAASDAVKARAKVLQEIGLPQARTSALTNDGPAGMAEFQTSRDPTTPQGLEARRVFDGEREALTSYGHNIASKTGGSLGTDGAALETRGETILRPFDDLQEYFDAQRKAAYATADERAKGVPTNLKGFQEVLNDDSHLTNQDRVGLKTGLSAYLKKLGVVDDDGNIAANAQQAETVRKYLNDEWSPQNSKFAGKLKAAIDDDVTKAAGDDIYKSSRAIVKLQKDTLENPKGISDILDSSGPGGINRKVPVGQVADKITNMPPAQLDHIVTTLRQMPDEIQPQAQAALKELQSHFASRLSEAGSKTEGAWSHRGVNQFLDANSARAPIIFGYDNPLLQDMNSLRAAGNILRVDRGYPGAAIQGRILQSKLLPGAVATVGSLGGEVIGSSLGMPGIGTAVGGAAGGAAGLKMAQRAGVKAMQRRMTTLSDLVNGKGPTN